MSQRKQITIPQTGPIWTKGGIMGPIITPYHEDVDTIRLMLSNGVKINEVLEDGTQKALTLESLFKSKAHEVENAEDAIEIVEDENVGSIVEEDPEVTEPAVKPQVQEQGKKDKGNKQHFNNKNNNRVQDPVVKK